MKQSSRFDKLEAPSQSRGWIATAHLAHLAMTNAKTKGTLVYCAPL